MDVRELTINQMKQELIKRSENGENNTEDYEFLFAEIIRIQGGFGFAIENNLLAPVSK